MTRGTETYTTQLVVTLDPRAKFNLEDRKAELDAAMRVYHLLGDMSFDVDRINGVRDALADRGAKVKNDTAFAKQLEDLSQKVDELRKKIVATKEGGAITGEERIREKTTALYGDLVFYEGRPADYQVARIDSLKKELGDVEIEFDSLIAKELPAVNRSLGKKKLESIQQLTRKAWDATNGDSSGTGGAPSAALRRGSLANVRGLMP
jgi:hypothetical protein